MWLPEVGQAQGLPLLAQNLRNGHLGGLHSWVDSLPTFAELSGCISWTENRGETRKEENESGNCPENFPGDDEVAHTTTALPGARESPGAVNHSPHMTSAVSERRPDSREAAGRDSHAADGRLARGVQQDDAPGAGQRPPERSKAPAPHRVRSGVCRPMESAANRGNDAVWSGP